MNKKDFFKICAMAEQDRLTPLANELTEKYTVRLIDEPHKTLVMLKARESVKNSLFYLGEALATECMLNFENAKGYALILGDSFEKAVAIAVLDGALNAKVSETEEILALISTIFTEQEQKRKVDNAKILASRVRFDVMEV